MRNRWTQRRTTHLLVGLVVLPALLCRLLVPPGFMLGTGTHSALTMQMCHGAGPLPAPAGEDGSGGQPRHDSPCVFAAAATVAPPSVELTLLGGEAEPARSPPDPVLIVFYRAPPRAHSARAPPGSLHFA
jgi:hypothetical protein